MLPRGSAQALPCHEKRAGSGTTVIRLLSAEELIDAVETALEIDESGSRVWSILNEIERRDLNFEI